MNLLAVLKANGIEIEAKDYGQFRIRGDYGRLAAAAIADASLAFHNNERLLEHKYSIPSREVILIWWQVFKCLEIDFGRSGRSVESRFAQYVRTKVIEPAYNFGGIEPRSISENLLPAALLLALYLVFTLLYGFSVLLLFDGLGVSRVARRESGFAVET